MFAMDDFVMSQDVISYAFVFRQATSHCYSSLAFLIYDWLLGLENEVQHIWMQPQKRVFRWLYIYFRYVSLLIQAVHPAVVEYLGGHDSPSSCLAWNIYAAIVGQLHVTAVEMVLAVRVYALFNRSRRIAFLIGFQILAGVVSSVVNAVYAARATRYHGYCILSKPPYQLVYHGIIVLSTQITLMGLISLKHVLTRRSGWGRTPIVSLLLRDSSAVLFVISALCLLTIAFCRLNGERATVMLLCI
ncbi:hypothetical protein EDB19DRAFT_516322 [Suillus lakei]|nr:hypothetical protein EDB19DRAFT_516322 [Suillus lakei]